MISRAFTKVVKLLGLTPSSRLPTCQYRRRTLLPSPVTSTTGYCCCFGSFSSFFLSFFLSLVGPQWGIRVQGLPLSGTRRWLCSCARCRAGLSGRSTPFSSGVISPLISSSILGTYRPGEFIFQSPGPQSLGRACQVAVVCRGHTHTHCFTSGPGR